MSKPAVFTQADIAKILKGAQRAGLSVASVEIDRSGKIVARFGSANANADSDGNEWDVVLNDPQERTTSKRH